MNWNSLHSNTDLKTVKYDINQHDWPEYWLNVARDKFPQIQSLEQVHHSLNVTEILALARHCQSACGSMEFCDRVDAYFQDIVKANTDIREWMIQRYFTIRIVIPNQARNGRLLPFHQGIWVGNGLGLRTIWTPFTETYDTNSMYIASWDDSLSITQAVYKNRWKYDKIQALCLEKANPISLKPGEAFLFQQCHLHGNVNNTTDITRWSMDGRILPKGGHYHRKLPGGYFRFLNEREAYPVTEGQSKKWISYAGWNTNFSAGIPLPMQRTLINNYCQKLGIEINDYLFENEFCDWLPSLEEFILNYNVGGIILCSIYCLPDDPSRRNELLISALEKDMEIHFANELAVVKTVNDIAHIDHIFEFVNENPDPNVELGLSQ